MIDVKKIAEDLIQKFTKESAASMARAQGVAALYEEIRKASEAEENGQDGIRD